MSLNPLKWYAQIKALFAVKGAIQNMKFSELSTSTGRLVLLNSIVTIVLACMGILPAVLVAKITSGLIAAYALYRTAAPLLEYVAKLTPTPKDDAVVAELAAAVKLLTDKLGTPADAAVAKGVDNVKTE